jgi:hypothetical protein
LAGGFVGDLRVSLECTGQPIHIHACVGTARLRLFATKSDRYILGNRNILFCKCALACTCIFVILISFSKTIRIDFALFRAPQIPPAACLACGSLRRESHLPPPPRGSCSTHSRVPRRWMVFPLRWSGNIKGVSLCTARAEAVEGSSLTQSHALGLSMDSLKHALNCCTCM